MAVPYTFGSATAAIPLSNLDSNFSTTITLGNTAIQLGNTVTTLNNMTLANATISSGNVTLTNVTVTTANVTTGNITTLVVGSGGIKSSGNVVVGTTTDFTSATVPGAMEVAGYGIYPYVNKGTTNTTDYTGFNWYTPTAFAGNNGASTQTIHAYGSVLNIKNDGTGGTNAVVGNGFNALVNVESSASTARLTIRGLNLNIGRSQAADLSTNASNLITGSLMSVGHFVGTSSTISTTSVYGYNTTNSNNGGNITTQAPHIITCSVGGASANTTVTTNAYNVLLNGFNVGAATGSTATVTTGANFYASGATIAATGTVTTFYGLYLGASTVTGTLTNNYGVYQADTAAKNYFGGNVGIGTASPTQKLTVNGNINLSSSSTYFQSGTSNLGFGATTSVSTSATTIYASSFSALTILWVSGNDGANYFLDNVALYSGGAVKTISSTIIAGTPLVRTYSNVGNNIALAMASGTYTIKVVPIEIA
jgi:hypothetical protein